MVVCYPFACREHRALASVATDGYGKQQMRSLWTERCECSCGYADGIPLCKEDADMERAQLVEAVLPLGWSKHHSGARSLASGQHVDEGHDGKPSAAWCSQFADAACNPMDSTMDSRHTHQQIYTRSHREETN